MMKNRILTLIITLFATSLMAQSPMCGDQLNKAILKHKYPQVESLIKNAFQNAKESTPNRNDTLTIPVVVHILYNTPEQNLSDDIVHSQLEVLNQDFNRLNEDAAMTRDTFLDVAGSAQIKFKLASHDPAGNTTSGITRTETDQQSFINFSFEDYLDAIAECGIDIFDPQSLEENIDCLNELLNIDLDSMKDEATGGISPWNVDQYMNIWVCNLSLDVFGMESPFILGFAYPPAEAPNFPTEDLPVDFEENDGVVVHYEAFGRNPNPGSLAGIADAGRTCVHEVGHYLGLRHIWGDGDCTMDDGLADTPAAGENSQPADIANLPTCQELHLKDSCTDDDLPDMIENYMDYSIETCQNMFTIDQVTLMRAMLEGPRAGLLTGPTNTIETDQEIIEIYPTIATNTLYINSIQDFTRIRIIDVSGSTLKQWSNHLPSTIDISDLSPGIYFVEAYTTKNISQVIKIIKQ